MEKMKHEITFFGGEGMSNEDRRLMTKLFKGRMNLISGTDLKINVYLFKIAKLISRVTAVSRTVL